MLTVDVFKIVLRTMEEQERRRSAESILERRRIQNRNAQRKRRQRRAEMERKQREAQQDQERRESSTSEETSHQRCHQCRFHNFDFRHSGSAETKASATQQHHTANLTSRTEPSDKDREALSKAMADKQDEFLSLPLSPSSPTMDLSHNYFDENGLYNEDISLDLDFAIQQYSEPHSNSSGVTEPPGKQQPLPTPRPRTASETPERPRQHPMRRWSTTTPSSIHPQVLKPVSPLATHNYNTPPPTPTFAPSLTSPSPSSPTNNKGKTPLHILTERGSFKTVSLLLESAIDIDAQDFYGRTALHLAVLNGHVAVAAKLLKAGADTDIVDYKGVGPVHIAAEMENEEMILLLMREGADFGVGIGESIHNQGIIC